MYIKKNYLNKLLRKKVENKKKDNKALFLNRNELLIPHDAKIKNKLVKKLKTIKLNYYPELDNFYKKLSKWLGLDKNEIFLTEGVSGAIKSLLETMTVPGKSNIIFPKPTFAMYAVYAQMFNLKIKTIDYNNNYELKFNKIYNLIDKNTALVFLPNPNVPVESVIDLNKIKQLANYCKKRKVLLVIDEVYYPFGGPTAIKLIRKYQNILIMRSFSKAFGLAGIRLGYLVGNKKNIKYVSKIRSGYETNTVSSEIASFFIDNYKIIVKNINKVKQGLRYIKNNLNKVNIEYNGGKTGNYIFINFKNKKLNSIIVKKLKEKKIYVRSGWPSPFDSGFCLSGSSEKNMKFFFNNLVKILKSIKYI